MINMVRPVRIAFAATSVFNIFAALDGQPMDTSMKRPASSRADEGGVSQSKTRKIDRDANGYIRRNDSSHNPIANGAAESVSLKAAERGPCPPDFYFFDQNKLEGKTVESTLHWAFYYYRNVAVENIADAAEGCNAHPFCVGFTYNPGNLEGERRCYELFKKAEAEAENKYNSVLPNDTVCIRNN